MAATKAALLITLLLLVHGSLVLGRPNVGLAGDPPVKPCPAICILVDYMTCPSTGDTKILVGCSSCCEIEDTGCQIYSNGKPICPEPYPVDGKYLRLN